jgi:hypothetical protein
MTAPKPAKTPALQFFNGRFYLFWWRGTLPVVEITQELVIK